jgi:hypothetical protein
MPVVGDDGHSWHDTPNIHLCTIRDFSSDVRRTWDLTVRRALSLSRSGEATRAEIRRRGRQSSGGGSDLSC